MTGLGVFAKEEGDAREGGVRDGGSREGAGGGVALNEEVESCWACAIRRGAGGGGAFFFGPPLVAVSLF